MASYKHVHSRPKWRGKHHIKEKIYTVSFLRSITSQLSNRRIGVHIVTLYMMVNTYNTIIEPFIPSTQPLSLRLDTASVAGFLLSNEEKSEGCFVRKWRSMFVVWPKYKTVFIQRRHNTLLSSSAWKNDQTILRFRAAIFELVDFEYRLSDRRILEGNLLCVQFSRMRSGSDALITTSHWEKMFVYNIFCLLVWCTLSSAMLNCRLCLFWVMLRLVSLTLCCLF